MANEAFARVKIDQLLKDADWSLSDGRSVRFEYSLDDGGKADYALFDRQGRALAVLEAKSTSVNLSAGEAQGGRYADQLGVPFVFLSNGEEVWFRDKTQDAHFRRVETVFSQDDLARRKAASEIRRDPLSVPIDTRIAGGGGRLHQTACIDVVCREIAAGRRKLLVEMATGTGKTRTAAALLKRLFEANWATRALFVVDRNTLAIQTEDAFAEHLPHLPCYRVPRVGRRFQDEKRVTIVTLQTLVNEYENYSSGYFDLIVIDECHRSIYGKWRRALDHFDGIKIGLTATPCIMRDAPDVDEEDRAAIRDTMRFFEVDRPTYSYSMAEAIADGHLVPYEIYRAMTARTAATDGFTVSRAEIDWDAMDAATRTEMETLFAGHDPLVVDPTALERKFTIPERNRAMVREFRDVLEHGYVGPNGVRRAPEWGKTIVFAVTKRHAETLARMFDEVFADRKPSPTTRYADFVVSGMGPEDTVDGQAKIKRFKKEPFPQILVSVNMLDTGFDCPEVRNLVMARFTHSSILYQQMRGRGTRQAPGKDRFTLWDFTGVTLRHGDDETGGEGGVVVVSEPKHPPPTPRRLLTLDVHDEIDPSTREWVTVDETGHAFMDVDEARAEALGAAFETWLDDRDFNTDQLRLLHLVKEQIKANAAELTLFESWRFDAPPLSMNGGFERARSVFGGETELEHVLASLNQAVFGLDSSGAAPDGDTPRPDKPIN
ncbi:Type I restriction enzyme, R subunit [Methylocella tundrae]|uniref:Type I restriction enzyme, R subunit n=1 Tax=Methylocella tundrae TaxID=227605 RepID=A0A8B6M617_METTU|nr:DEAD/DEAH box helicase family protein [Methylocella tundrae]VTZ25779.1 Type I restriction enzyme, R subunit [Methylocella tundrae]VTZ50278.1 Type I restriction enzyme, R subunit [Methylocella tundrae]